MVQTVDGGIYMTKQLEEGTNLTIDFKKMKKIQENVQTDVVPVAVQDVNTKKLLILAYANKDALDYSVKHGIAAFWSTSRNELWVKGKTSGNTLKIHDILVNCEQNSLLYLVTPNKGGACHTKDSNGNARDTCYYRKIDLENPERLEFLENKK